MAFVACIVVLSVSEVDGQRTHFYSRRTDDLTWLANKDFELEKQLKSFRQIWVHGNKTWPLLMSVNK